MVCNGKLTGVVSFGSDCVNEPFPGIYTKIQHFTSWIEGNLEPESKTESQPEWPPIWPPESQPETQPEWQTEWPPIWTWPTIWPTESPPQWQPDTSSTRRTSIVNVKIFMVPLILFYNQQINNVCN